MSYDETTTVEQLVHLLLGGKSNPNYLKIALFEVKQDIQNGEEYSFLSFQTLIADVFGSWKNPSGGKKYPYGKIVLPIDNEDMLKLYCQQQLQNATKFFNFGATGEGYAPENNRKANPVSLPTNSSNSNRTLAASYAAGSSYIATSNSANEDNNQDIGELSDEAFVMKNKLDDSQKEIERLQSLLDKTQKKLEVCKGIISRTSGAGSKHFAIGVGTGVSDGDTDSVLTTNTTINSTGEEDGSLTSSNTGKSSRRESWYNPFRSTGNTTSTSSANTTSTGTTTNTGNKLSKSSSTTNISTTNTNNTNNTNTNNQQSNVDDEDTYLTGMSGMSDGTNYYASERKAYFPTTQPTSSTTSGARNTPSATVQGSGSAKMTGGGGGAGFMLTSVEEDILKFPASYLQKTFPEQCSFIRTYFHHIDSLQHFLIKYDQFFQYMQPCIYHYYRLSAATASSQQIVSPEMLVRDSFYHSPSTPAAPSSPFSPTTTSSGMPQGMVANAHSMAESLAGLYHMLVSLDGIYSQCLTLSEHTRPQLRTWLLTVFPVVSRLPVVDTDSVLILLRCLMKEELLFSSVIQAVITKNIEYACLKNILLDTGNSTGNNTGNSAGNNTGNTGMLRLVYNDEEDFGYTLTGNSTGNLTGNLSGISGMSTGMVTGMEEEGKDGVPASHPGKNLAKIIQHITKVTSNTGISTGTNTITAGGTSSNTGISSGITSGINTGITSGITGGITGTGGNSGSGVTGSALSVLPIPFPVIKHFMRNILSTYTYVISDYSPLFPSEFHVLNTYLVTSFTIFNQVVKAYYRYAVGHSTITVYEAYAIFLFLHQYINQLEAHTGMTNGMTTGMTTGMSSGKVVASSNRARATTAMSGNGNTGNGNTGNGNGNSQQDGYRLQIIENVKVKKNEVRNICLFALKNEWEKQIKERLFAVPGKKTPGGGGATGTLTGTSGGANTGNSTVSGVALGNGYELVNGADHYAAFIPKQGGGNTVIGSGGGSAGGGAGEDFLCDAPTFPLCKWVTELMNFLTSFTQILFQTNLFQENNDSPDEYGGDAGVGGAGGSAGEEDGDDDEVLRALRASLFSTLFEHIQEVAPLLLDHYTTSFSTPAASRTPSVVDPTCPANVGHILLVGQINSCFVFLMQFTEYYLSLGAVSAPAASAASSATSAASATAASSPLEEKYLTICDQFHALVMRLVSLHTATQYTYDITAVLDAGGLLKKSSNWESDMQSVVALKKMNKVYVSILSALLLPDGYLVSGMWSNGLLGPGGGPGEGESGLGGTGNTGNGNTGNGNGNGVTGNSSWQCLLPGFLQLLTGIKLSYLTGMTQAVVSYYLEALLTSQYTTSSNTSFNATAFNHRLMEDLQMITAFIEENRLTLFAANTSAHYIRSAQSGGGGAGKAMKFLPFSKKSEGIPAPAGSMSGNMSGGVSGMSGNMSGMSGNMSGAVSGALESKELLHDYIHPLTHIICALNLSRKDLVAFTQQELYADFGYQNALRLWQILLTWRQEKKEHIQQDYDSFFKAWLPQAIPAHAEKIKYPLLYLTKLKAANIVKLSTTNTLMAGNFPVSGTGNGNGEWDGENGLRSGRASFSMQSTYSLR